jgi:uracil phosphoribosyltransferase
VNIENPLALHFIMQDELFFLKEDRETAKSFVIDEMMTTTADREPAIENVKPEHQTKFIYTGKKGELLVLVHYTDQEFIHETHLLALDAILKRRNLAVADIPILNLAKSTGADYEALLDYFKPGKILILGTQALPEGIPELAINEPKVIANKNILYSFSFNEMMDNPDNKRTFWEQMKNF